MLAQNKTFLVKLPKKMPTEFNSLCLNLVAWGDIKENKGIGHWLRMQGRRCVLLLPGVLPLLGYSMEQLVS